MVGGTGCSWHSVQLCSRVKLQVLMGSQYQVGADFQVAQGSSRQENAGKSAAVLRERSIHSPGCVAVTARQSTAAPAPCLGERTGCWHCSFPRTLWDEPFPWKVHPVSVRCDETLRLLQLFPPKVLPLNLLCLPSGGIVRYPNSLRCVEFLTFSAYEISNAPCYLYNLKRSSLKFYMWHLCEPYVIWQNTFNMSF